MIYLSVIIPTRNRANYLRGVLQSLTFQTYPCHLFEVIVVDNGSTDNTKAITASLQQQMNNIFYFFDQTPGLHVGRHLGMKMAKSDILVYADDDVEPFPTWLEAIAESFQDNDVALVGGKNLPKFESDPPEWVLKMWEKDKNGERILGYLSILDLGNTKKVINPYHVFGCNFSIRKSVLLEAGGFHPDAMPQELIRYRGDGETHVSQFIEKEEMLTIYNPDASVYHIVPKERLTEEYFCKRSYLQGISDSYTKIRKDAQNNVFTFYDLKWLLPLYQKKLHLFLNKKKRLFEKYYHKGYSMHQKASSKDQNLYEWIIQGHYMDDQPFVKSE